MRVSRIRYQPIEGGTFGGHFALHITLGADNGPESFSFDSSDLAIKIRDAFMTLDIKSSLRGVLIDARNVAVDSAEMQALLGQLRDWGIIVVAWVDEKRRAPWFELLNYLVVFVHSRNWSNFRVNEIRYVPSSDPWVEPEVFVVNQSAPGYVQLTSSDQANALFTFISNAVRPWGVAWPSKVLQLASVDFPLSEANNG